MTRSGNLAGLVLSPNEIWLLLHALDSAEMPRIGWDGHGVDPWVVGELKAKLRTSLNPEKIAADERRPAIALDSQMGRDLANAGIRPLMVDDSFDIGSMFDACAQRGWGVELTLPRGAIAETPASAAVHVRREPSGGEETYVGLEQPAVALARALIGALVATDAHAERASTARPDAGEGGLHSTGKIGDHAYEEFSIYATGIQQGRKPTVIAQMAKDGWELVRDEGNNAGDRLVFRRPQGSGA